MKKLLSLFLLSILVMPLSAQMQRGLKGTYILDSFPVVSFVWNTANTEELTPSQFVLYEGEKPVDSLKIEILPIDKSTPVNKSILILWEDMASHSRQSEFTRTMLSRFFREASLNNNDRFNVAVFNRQRDSRPHVLTPLLSSFSTDWTRLADAVKEYRKSGEHFTSFPMQSDLYLAINEGIDMLKKEDADRSGVIVVVTAGLNVKAAGASTEMETVRKNALEAGIPIYVVKYPLTGNAPEVNSLAESTYGLAVSSIDPGVATGNMKDLYRQFDNRLHGHDYKITFTTESKRDGKPHPLRLTVNKVRQPIPPYMAPNMTFGQWLAEYWWLVLIAVLVLAGAIVFIVILLKKRKKANQAMQEQMRREHEESEQRNRETVESIRREQEAKERAAQEAAARAQSAAEEERLVNLMRTKNLYPRLQCKTGNTGFTFTVGKPRITLGRNAENDVAFTTKSDGFDNMTVSGRHAEIVFNGSAFEVVNVSRSYTQGIVVNGQFCQRHTLRSGDMIGLGEAVITFYL